MIKDIREGVRKFMNDGIKTNFIAAELTRQTELSDMALGDMNGF